MNTYEAWSHPQLAAQVVRRRQDGHCEVALRVDALQGARQVLRLEQMIHSLPGVRRVAVDAPAKRVRVVWDGERTSLPALLQTFAAMRCMAQPLRSDSIDDARSREAHDMLKRLLVAGMCAMQVMTYAFVIYIGVVDFVDFTTRGLFRWLGLISTAPVVFYSAHPFVRGALQELRERRLGINLPVAIAVWLVFVASAINTVRGSGEIYFDSVSMFVFLLLAGRYIELKARHRSGALGDAVIDGTPLFAERRLADGSLETVPAIELLPADRVLVREGGIVPADGRLASEQVQVDESLLSGESRPVVRYRGDHLVAGSVLVGGPIELQVEHSGNDTAAARVGALSTQARIARDAAASADDVALRRFVARVLLLTLLTAAGWLLVDPQRAFESAVAVLVIACPCAFALTSPSALTRALGVLAQRGVLVADSAALARMAEVDIAVFDKTGTLTEPHIDVAQARCCRGRDAADWLPLAASLARESSHPLARAVAAAAGHASVPDAQRVEVASGGGISGVAQGLALRLGHSRFAGVVADAAEGDLWLADDSGPLIAFSVGEAPREDAAQTLQALRGLGIGAVIASGDTAARAAAMADRLGVTEWHAPCTPQDKLALLECKRHEGHITLAVGDGNNDAPVLAGADVSAALASGTDLAQAHADFLLLHGRLHGLVEARAIARQVRDVIAQGRRWSLGYNLCAVPFAALGLVPPWLAAIGMSVSSLAVVLNAWRIGRPVAREADVLA
ncbi:cation-transporting P-type ATPase [Dyella solisilvae]|uniref:Cation-transporting P-type ATPase n=1 Tax=Dyella solisilvae TaxID=1920168 RepID=A0A370K3Y7_9GAMM|nr:cation-translocating P-type ATPase [Dyella solisilvae]RDI97376.1 cation-transporting P-type ATPase [Dyella solisilvae]